MKQRMGRRGRRLQNGVSGDAAADATTAAAGMMVRMARMMCGRSQLQHDVG